MYALKQFFNTEDILGSFHIKSTRNCNGSAWILTKLGVFVVPMVLITHTNLTLGKYWTDFRSVDFFPVMHKKSRNILYKHATTTTKYIEEELWNTKFHYACLSFNDSLMQKKLNSTTSHFLHKKSTVTEAMQNHVAK